MPSIIKRLSSYWNRPLHEPTLAELEAMEQLIAELEAFERETGQHIICELPEFCCGFQFALNKSQLR